MMLVWKRQDSMKECAVNSKIIQHLIVPQRTFPHTPTLFFQHMQSKDKDTHCPYQQHLPQVQKVPWKGNCPAFRQMGHKCGGYNHFREVCHARSESSRWVGQNPYQKKGKQPQHQQRDRQLLGNYKGKHKGGGGGPNGTPYKKNQYYNNNKAYTVNLKWDSVLSEASGPVDKSNKGKHKAVNLVLSGPDSGMYIKNVFACNAVHSKMVQSTHNGSNAKHLQGAKM